MKHRNPIAVFFLSLITFGIYALVWQVKTKGEMNKLGAKIPSAWLLIIPFVNIYWLWKYCEGIDKVTNSKLSGVMAFVLLFLLGSIGMAIIQNDFNLVSESLMTTVREATPVQTVTPTDISQSSSETPQPPLATPPRIS